MSNCIIVLNEASNVALYYVCYSHYSNENEKNCNFKNNVKHWTVTPVFLYY